MRRHLPRLIHVSRVGSLAFLALGCRNAVKSSASEEIAAAAPAASRVAQATDGESVRPAATASAPDPVADALARLPFRRGERLEYQVKYGFVGVGSAALEVVGLDTVRGAPVLHTVFSVRGGVRVYRVNDRYESWFDPRTFYTLRAVQNIDQGSYERERTYEIFPERMVYVENDKPEAPTVSEPLDEGSFIFFLRSLPLEVGKSYEFNRYFRPDRNPVRVTVVRKERVRVPAGQFDAIVVQPTIKTTGIFGEGGRAEVWFTDDSSRTLVQLKSQLKFGSLNLYLKNRRPGTP
jgi:hypothetical protein